MFNRFGIRLLSTKIWSVCRGGANAAQLRQETVPLKNENIILKVNAVSINPIDQWIVNGRLELLQGVHSKIKRNNYNRIVPGREFHATVVDSKSMKFDVGDNVIGVKHPTESFGTLSEFLSASDCDIILSPPSLSPEEAASIGFTGLTLFSGLGIIPSLPLSGEAPVHNLNELDGKKILVIGATGGLGSLAVEILHSVGAQVDGIASQSAWLEDLPLINKISYKSSDYREKLIPDTYDLVLDCADGTSFKWISKYMNHHQSCLLSYSSPFLQMINDNIFRSVPNFLIHRKNIENQLQVEGGAGLKLRYGLFNYSACGFKRLRDHVEKHKIRPHISAVFDSSEVPKAFEEMASKRHFGKIVIKF